MNWTNIKSWATSHGYKVDREIVTESPKSYNYYWERLDPPASGIANRTFNLAKDIYNNITQDKFIEHQLNFTREIKYYKHLQ